MDYSEIYKTTIEHVLSGYTRSELPLAVKGLVFGWGVNDADYKVRPFNGYGDTRDWCPFYTTWLGMVSRCHGTQSKRDAIPREIAEGWRYFSVFKQWMREQDWEGKHLDKDILTQGGVLYGPETCIFVPAGLNSFFSRSQKSRAGLPYGVSKRVKSCGTVVFHGKDVYKNKKHTCATAEQAHKIWQASKIMQIMNLKNVYDMEPRLELAVEQYAKNLAVDLEDGKITEHFPWK